MSAGSWLGTGKDAIGDLPGDMNAWDKLQLGWLNYATAKAATKSTHKLGVAEYNTKDPQALVVELPKSRSRPTIATPAEGAKQWWSDMGDNLNNTLTRSVDLTGKSNGALTLKGWWDIEEDYDYLYTEVSTDGGANWTAAGRHRRRQAHRPRRRRQARPDRHLAAPTRTWPTRWTPTRARRSTSASATRPTAARGGKGFAADAITVTADGAPLFTDDAEGDDNGWTAKGFSRIGESFTKEYPQYYIAENRQYVSYDKTLKTGPYNFGWRRRPGRTGSSTTRTRTAC